MRHYILSKYITAVNAYKEHLFAVIKMWYSIYIFFFSMPFSTSQDLLYVATSVSVLWLTIFLCWLLYQAARVLQNTNRVMDNINKKAEIIIDAVEFVRKKVDGVSDRFGSLAGIVSMVLERFIAAKLSGTDKKQKKK